MKTTPTQLTENGGQGGAYKEPSPSCSSVYGMERYSAGYKKKRVNTNPTL